MYSVLRTMKWTLSFHVIRLTRRVLNPDFLVEMRCCSDSAYDALVRELKDLESQLPAAASKESVTSKVRVDQFS